MIKDEGEPAAEEWNTPEAMKARLGGQAAANETTWERPSKPFGAKKAEDNLWCGALQYQAGSW